MDKLNYHHLDCYLSDDGWYLDDYNGRILIGDANMSIADIKFRIDYLVANSDDINNPLYNAAHSPLKFNDIPTIPRPQGVYDIMWDHIPAWLADQNDWCGVELDPPFQRGYKWTPGQQSAFIEYQLMGGVSGKEIYWNCPGWSAGSKTNQLQIIDGKQRLLAITDFLAGIVRVFGGHTYKSIVGRMPLHTYMKFCIHELTSQLDVVNWYINMNRGGTIHTEDDMKVAYDYKKSLMNDE